ncbi:MAG: AAA family ATPase [Acidimicrobiaceae bacterium]|nr:AAA family ATPase [Acidimicrobiaceae bacterium]
MRLVWFELRDFRRFERAEVNLDAPVVALVGPNEAGKSSLLNALSFLSHSGEFDDRDFTRDTNPTGHILTATFLLDDEDREVLKAKVPEAANVRWCRTWREETGGWFHETIPEVPWLGTAAAQAQKTLTKLREMRWAKTASEELLERIDSVISWLPEPGSPKQYSEGELAEIEELRSALTEEIVDRSPRTLSLACDHIGAMIADETKPRPGTVALDLLSSRHPDVLDFSESDRALSTSYDLQDPRSWTNGLHNLARLAQVDLQRLADAAGGARPEVREELVANANECLNQALSVRWSQSQLKVRLAVQGITLEIYVGSDGGNLHRLEDRSDGLRMYLALIAFLEHRGTTTQPILVVDEAENHLHWDAQADLVKVLYAQDVASQVIYSTHSPGCLPHDLGQSVRAVVPTGPDRSSVKNWVWEDAAGFRPLLTHMGASAAALTPHRYAVGTEGISDAILLPSLICAAIGEDALPYQVVPGIAQAAGDKLRSIDAESDTMLYLTDGDQGGDDLSKKLRKQNVPDNRIFSLPDGTELEDLVSAETLAAAHLEELKRGSEPEARLELMVPEDGRSEYLKTWYQNRGLTVPTKRVIACRVLEVSARSPGAEALPLVAERHLQTLEVLHNSFMSVFDRSSEH